MNNKQNVTDEQTSTADLRKAIPEIASKPQEKDEISPKLTSPDAIVSAFLEQCRAVIEKKAANTEKNVKNNINLSVIIGYFAWVCYNFFVGFYLNYEECK